jgi:hypothetical protein
VKNLLLALCCMLLLAGCGVDWFPATTTTTAETVTASAGADKTQNGASTTAKPISITLTGTGTSSKGTAVTFAWSVTNATSGADASSVVTFGTPTQATTTFSATATGPYKVKLTVTSATTTSISASSTATITVTDLTEAITVSTGIPSGTPLTVDGVGATNAVNLNGTVNFAVGPGSVRWTATPSTNVIFGNISSVGTTFSASASGSYSVTLTATSKFDQSTAASNATIIVVDNTRIGLNGSYFPLAATTHLGATRSLTYSNGETITVQGTNTLQSIIAGSPPTVISKVYSLPSPNTTGGVFLTTSTVSDTAVSYGTGLPIIPTDLTAGSQSTTYTVGNAGTTGVSRTATLTFEIVPSRTVGTLPAFTNVLHIRATITDSIGTAVTDDNLPTDSWYALGVGLIENTNKRLTAYTP